MYIHNAGIEASVTSIVSISQQDSKFKSINKHNSTPHMKFKV